jgi:glycosyltransferase involved in cell wall biosynthesis
MRVGIDGKWFFRGNPSGRVVVRNHIEQLVRRNPHVDFVIFLDRKDKNKDFPFLNRNVQLVYVWGTINLISNLFVVPLKASRYKVDICIFQYFASLWGRFYRIVFIHDIIFESHPEYFTLAERLYFFPMKLLARKTDAICTVSENEKKRLVQYHYGSPDCVFVVPNGVNSCFLPSINNKTIEHSDFKRPFILYLGRINCRKNLENLVSAFGILENKGVDLILAGPDDGKSIQLEKKINLSPRRTQIKKIGFVNEQYLHSLMLKARVFCYVSHDEGFGLPPLEAMAYGIPVVAAKKGSLPEVCGRAAEYVNPSDPLDIARGIDKVLSDEKLQDLMRKRSKKRAAEFTWARSADILMSVIKRILRLP